MLDSLLALSLSFERIYNSENFVVRISEIKTQDPETMSRYEWDPMSRPSSGSLAHIEHTVFLVKRNSSKEYIRLQNYELLHTEIRALLFKHSYGYDLALLDFGQLTAL